MVDGKELQRIVGKKKINFLEEEDQFWERRKLRLTNEWGNVPGFVQQINIKQI